MMDVFIRDVRNCCMLNYSYSLRLQLYGLLTAAYPIAQFFGAPILGALADISNEKTKSRNFGFVGMAFGLGFVIGPYIGGKLSDNNIVDWFSYDTPFFLSIIFTLINIFLVICNFPETLPVKRVVKIYIFSGFKNIRRAFNYKKLRIMFLVVFLLNIGHNFFTKFLQIFLMTKFNYTQSKIGDFYGYMGLWIALSQGLVLRSLCKKYGPASILSVSVVMSAFIIPLILLPNNSVWLYLIIPFIAILQCMNQPNTSAIVSNIVGKDKQGEILGINQSMQAISQAIPPLIAGFVTAININLPTIFSAAATIIAWAIFILFFNGKPIVSQKY